MLAWLAELSGTFPVLNVFRYITFRAGGATATALEAFLPLLAQQGYSVQAACK